MTFDRHDIPEILLKVALNTINQTKTNQISHLESIVDKTFILTEYIVSSVVSPFDECTLSTRLLMKTVSLV